jgi:hypothetical protein
MVDTLADAGRTARATCRRHGTRGHRGPDGAARDAVLQPVQDLTLLIWSATDSGRLILVWLSRNDGAAMWRIQFARPMRDAERDFWLKETS